MNRFVCFLPLLVLASACSSTKPAEPPFRGSASLVPETKAELIASDASWGNTEGPAIDSKGTLYFTSRGTYKGIVSWTAKDGAKPYLAVATKEGPGGLWIDDNDNIFLTATGEQQILKVSPDKTVTVVAENFDVLPGVSKGPNDLIVHPNGTIYFTAPNGYDGTAPKGTIYQITPDKKVTVFSNDLTGPNGIMLSPDKLTLYVAHNVAANTSKIESFQLNRDGTHARARELATIEPCQADGMDVDELGNIWLTCYSHGTAYRLTPGGAIVEKITTEQKALTNAKFGRGADNHSLYLTSSDAARVTGYVYRATVKAPGLR
jgi:gluconolactonase